MKSIATSDKIDNNVSYIIKEYLKHKNINKGEKSDESLKY